MVLPKFRAVERENDLRLTQPDVRDGQEQSREPGIIPYRLAIGVTGHRALPDDPFLAERVRDVINRIVELAPKSGYTPVRLAVISPLAEGADRLVVREVLAHPGSSLEVPLPLPSDDYATDFSTPQSRAEFEDLLRQASIVIQLPAAETRAEAYAGAGEYTVRQCDVLIALWDGEAARGRGGTAEVVAAARAQGVPVFWIETIAPYPLTEELGNGLTATGFEQLDSYNRLPVPREVVLEAVARRTEELCAEAKAAGISPDRLRAFCDWTLPYMARADVLAVRYQRLFFRTGAAIFYLAAAAASIVGVQRMFFSNHPWVAVFEVLCMAAVLGLLVMGRRWRFHERWTSYRFLAEHFRVALFLAVAGVGSGHDHRSQNPNVEQLAEAWLRRASDEVWGQRPQMVMPEGSLEPLKRFLTRAWIVNQRDYQQRASVRNHRRHRRLSRATVAIFTVTLIVALFHVLDAGGPNVGATLVVLSIALPATAGALHGVGTQREYVRNAQRAHHMVGHLTFLQRRMEDATTMSEVRRTAQEAEALMLSENREWFVVMQFHDFELHV
ncbi:MAG TPA: hypothetical protein VFB58_18865 [Chloroflexota bacterium]|nr:hypothetical protein [Chloroflexota bacterium]